MVRGCIKGTDSSVFPIQSAGVYCMVHIELWFNQGTNVVLLHIRGGSCLDK